MKSELLHFGLRGIDSEDALGAVPPVTAAAEACSLLDNVKLAHKALAQAALRQMAVAENIYGEQ